MGAMASKKASELASSLRAIAVASASEVSGPVATMPGDSSSVTSPRATVIPGWPVIRSCTPCANATRSTASAAPPGTRAWSAASSTTLPSRRISTLSSPWALVSSTDLKELEQTSSANRSVWCAAVIFAGRISCSVTAIPARPAPRRPRCPRVRHPPPLPSRSARHRLRRRRLLDRDFVSALEALARDPFGLGLLLFHPDEPAARAGDRDRAVPRGVVALRVAQAPEEVPSLPRAALRQVAHAALRALHPQRHGSRVLARGEPGAGEELAVAPRLDHHRRAALLADLIGGLVRHLVAPQRPREPALVGVAGAGDERAETPAPHHQTAAARRALLLGQAREVVHVVDQLLHVHRVERLGERPPEVAQHLLPREIAFLHLVELIFRSEERRVGKECRL